MVPLICEVKTKHYDCLRHRDVSFVQLHGRNCNSLLPGGTAFDGVRLIYDILRHVCNHIRQKYAY